MTEAEEKMLNDAMEAEVQRLRGEMGLDMVTIMYSHSGELKERVGFARSGPMSAMVFVANFVLEQSLGE